ncbi:hypothetical protein HQ586_01350 [Candidatus Bathyarchaeota archaeon]|nr:hypothetical protein [Candidatus Bathyarchaeota archaeon]
MPENIKKYERKVTAFERLFYYSPFSIVTVVARIKGNITVDMLMNAVEKVQQRHTNLRVRIRTDPEHNPWFTTEGMKEIPIEIISRESDNHWIKVHHEASQIPFRFNERPAIRLILVHSPEISELIILCHHIICDGFSLAYLARDLMVYLGDPAKEVEILSDPVPIDLNNLPKDVSLNPVVKFFIKRINKGWRKEKVHFDQEDYRNLNEAYWMKAQHKIISIELSESQTTSLVERCREEEVTVNSALTTAFVGAPQIVQGRSKELSSTAIAGSLRDRLQKSAGEEMGFFAGAVTLNYSYDEKKGFWDNARRLNQKVQPLYTNKNLFKEGLTWCHLEPGILEAMNFKKLGGLVPTSFSRHEKLSAFSKRDDVISSILKREKMETLDKIFMGTAVTNLTRMDFPRKYGDLELDRLIMNPGGAFPLSNVNLVLGAVTCSGKLSLVVEYEEGTVETDTMIQIKDKAMEFLLNTRD